MRRRDKVFLGLLWGALLASLAWALSTQSRWVRENKPLEVKSPPKGGADEPAPDLPGGSRVIGTVNEDTAKAMSKGLDSPAPEKAESKSDPKPKLGKRK